MNSAMFVITIFLTIVFLNFADSRDIGRTSIDDEIVTTTTPTIESTITDEDIPEEIQRNIRELLSGIDTDQLTIELIPLDEPLTRNRRSLPGPRTFLVKCFLGTKLFLFKIATAAQGLFKGFRWGLVG